MDIISKIQDLQNFGIDLKLDSKEMEVFYVSSMKYFFDEKEDVYCIQVTDRELEISSESEQLATVYVKDSVLRIVPLGDNPYAVVMDVLEFVAHLHKPTVALYREMNGNIPKTELKPKQQKFVEEESEEDSSDEWI